MPSPPPSRARIIPDLEADEFIRTKQQGRGRPIVSTKVMDQRIVAVGNKIHWSSKWKTFPDFLTTYMFGKLGSEWVRAERAKPACDKHPMMSWAEDFEAYQKATIKNPGEVTEAIMTGVVACFLGTAYALYLLEHNVELQDRLLKRLKDVGQFQGAYYELFVASTLLRAGFSLTLEDETDGNTRHCEFAAISTATKTRYWVEAKMRGVTGLLGRTESDGGPDERPYARLIKHLNDALGKPAADQRLIFIDVNVPHRVTLDGKPDWLEGAMSRLKRYEETGNQPGKTAFVFVTNMAFHRDLNGPPMMSASPFGLGIPDFNRPGLIRVVAAYRRKKKYSDIHALGQSLESCLRFPTTFDGKLPSEAFGYATSRVKIGETYFFPDAGEGGTTGVVDGAVVMEDTKTLMVFITANGQSQILSGPMSDPEFLEYKEFGDAFFGRVPLKTSNQIKDPFQFFEWLMEVNQATSRKSMLEWFSEKRNRAELEQLSDEELRMLYCEAHLGAMKF